MFKNRKHTPEAVEKMRLSKLGKKRAPFSEEWRKNLSVSLLGNARTKGHRLSNEHKKKISDAVKGENHPLFGKKFSEESRAKMSKSHQGQPSWNRGRKFPQISGAKHWNWKGGITSANHAARTSLENKLWREAVFARDGHTCIFCLVPGGWNKEQKRKIILNADHIKPFSLYPELRFAIDNGRTLCLDCHKATPTYAGRVLKTVVI